jgi:hypothetical protein
MPAPGSSDAPTTEPAPARATGATAAPGPYDDLLCTICNLKACWMTPEAAGKAPATAGAASPAETQGAS